MSSSSTIAIYSTYRPRGRREDRCSEEPHLDALKSPVAKKRDSFRRCKGRNSGEIVRGQPPICLPVLAPVVSLARDDAAYTTCGIFDGAPATRGQMGVAVEDGPPRSLAVVDTDGEPFHASIRLLGGLLLLLQETVLGAEFRTTELEEALHVPLRDFALPPTTILFRFSRWVSGVTHLNVPSGHRSAAK